VGAFVAALCFVFYLIAYLNPIELAAIIILLNLCSVVFYLTASGEAPRLRNTAALVMLPALVVFLFSPGPRWLHERSARVLWYEHSLQSTRDSVYANLAIIKDEEQYTFFANGSPYATTPQPPAGIEEQVHFPMLFHPSPEQVLVMGGGAGGFIREILRHPVRTVDYAEQDPLLIECFTEYATPLTEYELNHERVTVHPTEGRRFLKNTPRSFDLILVHLPVPSTLLLNRYYTADFFRLAGSRLREKGIFSISLPGSETFLSGELKELNRTIHVSLREAFPHVRVIAGEENIFLASNEEGIESLVAEIMTQRLHARGITGGLMSEGHVRYKTDRARFGPMEKEIAESGKKTVNRDTHPAGVFESMVFMNMIASPVTAGVLAWTAQISLASYLAAVAAAAVLLLALQSRRKTRLSLAVAIFTTGFAGMFMTMLLILAFQIMYGNIYHYIGLITSLFMLGLACGSRLAMMRPRTSILAIESGIVLHAALVSLFFFSRPEATPVSLAAIFALTFLSGALTGMEYPVSVSLLDRSFRAVSETGGRLYAIDLAGGFLSALITPVVLIPAMGIGKSLLLVMALKAGSLLLVYAGRNVRE
jgi:spermidine synthase